MRVPDTIAGHLASEELVQSVVDSLLPGERELLGGVPGTPYMHDDEYDDLEARFLFFSGENTTIRKNVHNDEKVWETASVIPLDALRNMAIFDSDAAAGFLDLYRAGGGASSITVAVRPEARGIGAARRLVEEAQEWLWRTDGTQLNWFARRENGISIELAKRCGFRERDDYRDDPEWWGGYWTYED